MKNKFMILCIVVLSVLVGCGSVETAYASYNKSFFDTTYSFEYAQIKMPDGTVVDGKVDEWTDFEDGDQIQVTIGGRTYLTHSCNVVLVSED